MEKLLRTCVVLLVAGVILTAYSGVKVNTMTRELQDLKNGSADAGGYQWQSLQSELASLRNALHDLKESTEWVTSIDIIIGERRDDLVPVFIDWQVKELPEDAIVTLYLKHADDLDYTAYEAFSTGGGGYRAVLELPYRLNPEVRISISYTHSGSRPGSSEAIATAPRPAEYPEDLYDYYIGMSGGGQIKTTEASSLDLGKVGSHEASPLSLEVHNDDGDLRVSVSEMQELIRKFRPIKATLHIVPVQTGESEIIMPLAAVATKPEPDDFRRFEGEIKDAPSAVSHYVVVLEYSDGSEVWTVEKVVR